MRSKGQKERRKKRYRDNVARRRRDEVIGGLPTAEEADGQVTVSTEADRQASSKGTLGLSGLLLICVAALAFVGSWLDGDARLGAIVASGLSFLGVALVWLGIADVLRGEHPVFLASTVAGLSSATIGFAVGATTATWWWGAAAFGVSLGGGLLGRHYAPVPYPERETR